MSRRTTILTLAEGLLTYDVGALAPEEYAALQSVFGRARRLRHHGEPGAYQEVDETMKEVWGVRLVPSDCVKPAPGAGDVTRVVERYGEEVDTDLRKRFAKLRADRTALAAPHDPEEYGVAEIFDDTERDVIATLAGHPDESLDRGDLDDDETWGVIPDCTFSRDEKGETE